MQRRNRRPVLSVMTAAGGSVAVVASLSLVPSAAAAAPSAGVSPTAVTVVRSGSTAAFPAGTAHAVLGSATDSLAAERLFSTLDDRLTGRTAGAAKVNPTGVPVVTPTSINGTARGLARSLEGINAYQNSTANLSTNFGPEPPDQGLCVGNGYVFEAVNDAVRVFRTSGAAASRVASLNAFYGYPPATNPTTGRVGPELTDPSCIYDAGSNRFYVLELTLDTNPKTGALTETNSLDLAVSKTGNPLGGWNIYRVPATDDGSQGTPKHRSCPCLGDYPHLGADKYGVYLTSNEFTFTGPGLYGGYNGVQLYALGKQQLASGAARARVLHYSDLSTGSGQSRLPSYHVWPGMVPGSAYPTGGNGTEYFLGSLGGFFSRAAALQYYRLTNTASLNTSSPSPVLRTAVLASQPYASPPNAEQKVGPTPLADCITTGCLPGTGPGTESEGPVATNDAGLQQVYYSGGVLYAALTTAVQVRGNIQSGVAWFAVTPDGSPAGASVRRQGYLAATDTNLMFPAVAVRPDGSGVIGFSLAGKAYYPSSGYVRLASGAARGGINIAAAGLAPEDGHCEYAFFNCAGTPTPAPRPRWGDYSAATVNSGSIWFATEYIGHSCTLATFQHDQTCGHTRVIRANWDTRISRVNP